MIRRLMLFAALSTSLAGTVSCDTAPVDDDLQRQIIVRGNGGEPGTLDPVLADDIHAFNVLGDLYEGLVAETANGTLVPGVAESWTVSRDGLIYTFQLRDDARWSNGDPVVAQDFERSFRRAASPATASGYAFLLEPIQNFPEALAGETPPHDIGVSAPSPNTLVMRLSDPASHWLSILTMPIAFPVHPSGGGESISNGAFKLKERQAGGPIRLQRNEHFWAAESVQLDEVVYVPIVDLNTELNMYRAGELDVTHSVPTEFIQTAKTQFSDELRIAPSLALYYLAFDLTETPFNNRLLRQALTMALDRTQLVSLLGRGERPAYSIVPPGVAGYDNTEYDWQSLANDARERRANVLYGQAGYSATNPLRIKFTYDAGNVHERVALAVTAMWRDVLGVETSLDKKEWKYLLDTRDQRSEWDVMRFAWFGDYNAATTFLDIFESGNPQNLARYQNSDYDRQLAAASKENNAREAATLMQSAESTLIQDYPIVPLYFFVSKHLVKPHIVGFEDNVMDRHPSRYLAIENGD